MYEVSLSIIPHLKQRILKHIEAIPHDLLQHAMVSVPGGTQECSGSDGGHVKSVIFRY
jgi:hypothetical protein